MKTLLAVILLMALQSSYKLETKEFEINLPAEPTYRTQAVNVGSADLTLHLYILEQGTTYYIVSHSYYPLSIDLSNPEQFFNGVIGGMVTNYQGTLLSEENHNAFGAVGKRVQVQLPDDDLVEVHYYLKDRVLYQVLIKANPAEIQSQNILNSFNSFKLY
jgi:hypothetical protein